MSAWRAGRRCGGRAAAVALMILAGGAAAAAAQAPAGAPLDIAAVLRLAATQSRAAVVAGADSTAAAAAISQARAAWWPSVDFAADYTIRDNPVLAAAGPFSIEEVPKSNGEYALTARQILWDGGRRGLAVSAARRREAAVREGGRSDVQQAQLAALGVYLGALELQGNGWVLAQRLGALRAHLDVVRAQLDHGLVARNDLLETEVRVREVEDAAQAVASRREVAVQDLNRQLGRDPGAEATLPDSLPPPPALPGDRAQLLASAAQANPLLQAAGSRLEAERAAAALARRAWWPNLFLAASHAWTQNDFLVFPHVNAIAGGVSWDVFDGGIRAAGVRQADAGVVAASRDRLEVERGVAIAVERAWSDWDQAQREERTAHANVAATVENLRIVEDQYRAGLARSSDVLDAEALLAASRFNVVTKHYATYRAQAALLAAAGRDLAAFYGAATGAAGER